MVIFKLLEKNIYILILNLLNAYTKYNAENYFKL